MQSDTDREAVSHPPNAFCSWSGGKDSYLALHRANATVRPMRLVTMMIEDETMGIDACGENGEFHTVVLDAPMFNRPVCLTAGEIYERDGHWSMDFTLDGD